MIGTTYIPKRLAVDQLMLMLLITANGAKIVLAVGVAFIDPLSATQTGTAMVITIGGYKDLVACECVIVGRIAASSAGIATHGVALNNGEATH